MGFSFLDFMKFVIKKQTRKNETNKTIKKQEKEKIEKDTFITIGFDDKFFRKVFCEEFENKKNSIEQAVEISLKKTFAKLLKEYNPDFDHLNFSLFAINTYKMGKTCSYQDLLTKGFYITNIRGSFRNKRKIAIDGIEIKSEFFTQYSDLYDFVKTKTTPKLTCCKFEITNALLNPNLFSNLLDVKNCECQNLRFFDHYHELPLLFICPVCGKLYMCDCQKEYYEIIHKHNKQIVSPSFFNNYEWHYPGSNPSTDFEYFYKSATYKSKICFLCNNTIPPEVYSYSEITTFGRRYEPYIKALIDSYYEGSRYNDDFSLKNDYGTYKEKRKEAENIIRKKAGYPLIGEKWLNETTLYKLCCILFADYQVIREYSPAWLHPQRLDIAIPELNLGIEYQGEQHFKAVERFGGEDGLEKRIKQDKRKKDLCKENGLTLVYFNYNEELSEEIVKRKLKKFLAKRD